MTDLARQVIQVSADDVTGPGEIGSQDNDIVHEILWEAVSAEFWFGGYAAPLSAASWLGEAPPTQRGFGHFDKIASEKKQA